MKSVKPQTSWKSMQSIAAKVIHKLNSGLAFVLTAQQRRTSRRLRVCESVGLGDKRFLAVVQFERQQFLLGVSGSSITLLARLERGRDDSNQFATLMARAAEREFTIQ